MTKGTTYTIEEEKNDDYNTGIEMSWGTGTSAVSQKINGTVASNKIVRTAYEYQYMLNSINNDINRLKSAARNF